MSRDDDCLLFHNSRLGDFDEELLRKLGLSKIRMETEDFLFFNQLLLPICDTFKSEMKNNPGLPHHSNVEKEVKCICN